MKSLIQSALLLLAVLLSTAEGAAEVIYAQEGETVTLKAPGELDSRKYLYWSFGETQLAWGNSLGGKGFNDNESWKPKLSMSGDSLVINNIQAENFGTFFCKRSLKDGSNSLITYKVLKLTVKVIPPSPVLPGDSLSLSCSAETLPGVRTPETRWLTPQGEEMRGNPLSIKAASQHSGKWTCVLPNKIKEVQVSVTVLDLSPAPSRPQYTSKSRPLYLPCSLPSYVSWEHLRAKNITEVHWNFYPKQGSSPRRLFNLLPANLTWQAHQNTGLRRASEAAKGNLSLTRNRAKEEDEGDYECGLKFKNGVTLQRTVRVELLQIASSLGTEVTSGQQLNLTCSLGHTLPSDLQLKWIPPRGSSLPPLPSDRHPDHLTIRAVGTGDSGKWKCELWQNGTRLTSAEITLKIEPKLSVWMLVVISSVAVIVILVLILLFILFRRRQRKMGHLRRQLCQCKTPKPKGFYRS